MSRQPPPPDQDMLVDVKPGNPAFGVPDKVFLVEEGQVISAPKTPEVRTPDVFSAMASFESVINKLGLSNEAAGIEFVVSGGSDSTYESVARNVGGANNLKVIGDVLAGSGNSRRDEARREYLRAVQFLAGRDVDPESVTFRVGYEKFASVYGRTGKDAQTARRKSIHQLAKARQTGNPELPISVFFDPEVTVYASSVLGRNNPSWQEVMDSLEVIGGDVDRDNLPKQLESFFKATDQSQGTLLNESESQLLKLNLTAANIASRRQKLAKIYRESGEQPLTAEQIAQGKAKGVEVVTETASKRVEKIRAHLVSLRKQSGIVQKVRLFADGQPFAGDITNEDIDTVTQEIIPDIVTMIAGGGLSEQRHEQVDVLTSGLLSTDRGLATSVSSRLLWSLEDRIGAMEEAVIRIQKEVADIAQAAFATTMKKS